MNKVQIVLEVHKRTKANPQLQMTSVDITPLYDMITAGEFFEIERALNEHVPHLRFHISLNQIEDEIKEYK